jgi:alpha-L-rhamnosidase
MISEDSGKERRGTKRVEPNPTIGWIAEFITPSFLNSDSVESPAPYMRRSFELDEGLSRAVLWVTALGLIEPYVNGNRVGDEVLTPGWTSYRHRLVVDSYDVTDLLTAGENVVGVIVGNGWAVGRLTWNDAVRKLWADRPAAFVQLELDYGNRQQTITSNGEWRSALGAILANDIYDGERYDARREPVGWSAPSFDDSAWATVDVVEWETSALVPRTFPPIRRIEELRPTEVLRTPAGKTIVDFGQNLSGWVRFSVSGEAGATVRLHHSEVLVDGEPDYDTNRTAKATDEYTLSGDRLETWEPRFTFHGFRYVEIEGWPGEVTLEAFRGVVTHSDMTRTGWFETSNELLNRFHNNVVWSMRDNFVGLPTDCPQRDERLGWTGDINAFGSTAAFLYDTRGVLGSWLDDLVAEQKEKGYVPYVVPDALRRTQSPTALWADVVVSLPWTLYWRYGETELLARCYDSMTAYIESVHELLDEQGLWSRGWQFGDWLDPDAPPDNSSASKTDAYLIATAYLCKTTREMARTAVLLGQHEAGARYWALHDRVRTAFRNEWVSPSGRLVNETATAYALVICFDLLESGQEERAGSRLAALVKESGYRISTGFAGTPFVLDALSRTGHLETAYALLLQTECPSFLYPVTMGATTIWERWDAVLPDGTLNRTGMTSLNHYALGAVADWLHRVVGGISPARPGYKVVRIAPEPGGNLTSCTCVHDTPHGRIAVDWNIRTRNIFSLRVQVPEGIKAEVHLPRHPADLSATVAEGRHAWEYQLATSWLDTTVAALAADPTVWPALSELFAQHFSELGWTKGSDAQIGEWSLRTLQEFAFRPGEFVRDVANLLGQEPDPSFESSAAR